MNRYIIKNIPIHHKIIIKQWVNSSFIIVKCEHVFQYSKIEFLSARFRRRRKFFRENASPLVGLEIHKIEANNEDCSSEARWTNNGWNEIKRENSSWGGREKRWMIGETLPVWSPGMIAREWEFEAIFHRLFIPPRPLFIPPSLFPEMRIRFRPTLAAVSTTSVCSWTGWLREGCLTPCRSGWVVLEIRWSRGCNSLEIRFDTFVHSIYIYPCFTKLLNFFLILLVHFSFLSSFFFLFFFNSRIKNLRISKGEEK